MPRAGIPNADARERTRRALLEAGLAILGDTPVEELLSQVTVKDVAKRAGLSPGAVYHYWDSQDDYRRALLETILSTERFRADGQVAAVVTAIRQATERAGATSIRDSVHAGASKNFEMAAANPASLQLQLSLWAKHDDETVRELLAGLYRSLNDDFMPLYEKVVADSGRQFRPPFDARSLAVVLTALVEGLLIRHAVDQQAVPAALTEVPRLLGEPEDPQEGTWDLFAAASYFIACGMTEPRPDAAE